MRGPKPKPTRLKVLRGNPGRRKLNDREPQIEPSIPDPPDWLKGRVRAKWDEVCERLGGLGILTRVDADVLTLYCRTWVRWQQAEEGIDEEGILTTTPSGIVRPSALVTISNNTLHQLRSLQAELGMTRSRVQTVLTTKRQLNANRWKGILPV